MDLKEEISKNFSRNKLLDLKKQLQIEDYKKRIKSNRVLNSFYNNKEKSLDISKLKLKRYLEEVNRRMRLEMNKKRKKEKNEEKRSNSTFIMRKEVEKVSVGKKFAYLG